MPYSVIDEETEHKNAIKYINLQPKYVTVNMLKKHAGIRKKIALRVLRSHPNTMICEPIEFGSNQRINQKLYKKINNYDIHTLCNKEFNYMKKNNKLVGLNVDGCHSNNNYDCLTNHMIDKYRISLFAIEDWLSF